MITDEIVAWEFQHDETGRTTFCEVGGGDSIESFTRNNPRMMYVGPLYRHAAVAPMLVPELRTLRARLML